MTNSTSAPVERPIQLRCIASTLVGHAPSSWLRSSSNRSAYSVTRKYHCVRDFFVTVGPHPSCTVQGTATESNGNTPDHSCAVRATSQKMAHTVEMIASADRCLRRSTRADHCHA